MKSLLGEREPSCAGADHGIKAGLARKASLINNVGTLLFDSWKTTILSYMGKTLIPTELNKEDQQKRETRRCQAECCSKDDLFYRL